VHVSDDPALLAAEETVRLLLKSRAGVCERLVADAAVSHGLDAQQRACLEEKFVAQIHADRSQARQTAERNARADERIVKAVHSGYYAFRRAVIGAVVLWLLVMLVAQLQR